MIEIVGELSEQLRGDLRDFCDEATRHPWGVQIEGRLVVAEPHPGGLRPTIERALRQWMTRSEFREWQAQQQGRPVATGAKTFVADDDVVTAVVCAMPDRAMFLGLASHELLEVGHRVREREAGVPFPTEGRSANGVVIADEYVTDRARSEIADRLGWTESVLDREPGLVSQTDGVAAVLRQRPFEGPPSHRFWLHWANLARVWAMVAGRADADVIGASEELDRWRRHELVAHDGWSAVRETLRQLYRRGTTVPRAEFIERAADGVWDPLETYGRTVWLHSSASRLYSTT